MEQNPAAVEIGPNSSNFPKMSVLVLTTHKDLKLADDFKSSMEDKSVKDFTCLEVSNGQKEKLKKKAHAIVLMVCNGGRTQLSQVDAEVLDGYKNYEIKIILVQGGVTPSEEMKEAIE